MSKTSLPMIYIKALSYVFVLPMIMLILLNNISILKESFLATFIIICFVIFYIPISAFFTLYLYLAPNGVCFLFALENVATLIQSGGAFVGVAYSSKNLTVDKNTFEVTEEAKKDNFIRKMMKGLTFFGITPYKDVLYILLKHNKTIQYNENGFVRYRVEKTQKNTCRIDLRVTNYGMDFSGMETKERNQISAIVTVTLRVSNIYTFLKNKDPYDILEAYLISAFRIFIKGKGTDELIGSSENDKKALLGKESFEYLANSGEISNIQITKTTDKSGNIRLKIENLGFELRNFSILDIILTDKSAEEASRMLYAAEKEKESLLVKADGEAQKIIKIGSAEAQRIASISETCKKYQLSTEEVLLIGKIDGSQAEYYMHSGNVNKRDDISFVSTTDQTIKKE